MKRYIKCFYGYFFHTPFVQLVTCHINATKSLFLRLNITGYPESSRFLIYPLFTKLKNINISIMRLKGYNLAKNKFGHTLMSFVFVLFLTNIYGQDIVINEINYRSVELEKNIDFIELHNTGNSSVDLSGWQLTNGISYQFPSGASISAGGYLVVCGNPADCQSEFSFSGAYGPFTGALSSESDDVVLRNSLFKIIDGVDYESWKEWPNVRHLDQRITIPIRTRPSGTNYTETTNDKTAISIQKINPNLDGNHGGAWSADIPTPKAKNTSVFQSNYTQLPIIKDVTKSPDKPMTGEAVRIKADFDDFASYAGSMTVELEYQTMNAGSYIAKSDAAYQSGWNTIQMLDNGVGADSTANNGIYTAVIPASVQQHRRLVRYRVKVSTTNGFSKIYPDPKHTESNYAYYVYDGHANFNGYSFDNINPMQDLTVITKSSIANQYIGNGGDNSSQYNGYEYLGEGTIVYNGKVYDHVRFRPRGKTRAPRVKPGVKFDMNSERKIQLVDDCGEEYDVPRGKLVISGTWVNDAASHGLVESLVQRIMELTGGMYKSTDYTSLRIVDSSTEAGNSGDFWGIYLISEEYDSDLLKEHKLPDGNIWTTYDPVGATRFSYVDSYGDFPGASTQGVWQTGSNVQTTPNAADLDKKTFFGDWIANEFWGNGEDNYVRKHSYREYYNPVTGKWHGWCKDYDGSFGSGNNVRAVSTTSTANVNEIIQQPLLIPGSLQREYEGELRSAYDLLLNQEQRNFLVDSELKKIYNQNAPYDWTTLDHSRWNNYQTYPEGNVDAHFQFYKNWFRDRAAYILNDGTHGIADNRIPNKPTINLTGTPALDNLTFSNSTFTDPNGNGTFAALEWRVAEWSDPSNPIYDNKCEAKYEIETKWRSGQLTTFTGNYTIPADAQLKVGRTYKVRVRYKDSSGRWSHWSNPVEVVPTPAAPANYDLVINEIMYNDDADCCGGEYVEIYNNANSTVTLNNFKFTEGIDYDFPNGANIPADGYIVLARDSNLFVQKYGFSPFGDYKGSLSDGSEDIVLEGPYRTVVDTVRYDDNNGWDENPDGEGTSLELLNPNSDNAELVNWFRSDVLCGTPGVANTRVCTGTAESIVINEINYNSDNGVSDPGDWVELYNPGGSAVDISGWEFYNNDTLYTIPAGTTIGADDYLILVEDTGMFTAVFTHLTANQYIGNISLGLSGKGDRVSLFNENKCLSDYVAFDDKLPWPEEPDGGGPTLSLIAPNSDNALPQSWESSSAINSAYGTPGRENTPCLESIIVAPTGPVCIGYPITMTVDNYYPDVSYTWYFIGGSPISSNAGSEQVTWNTPGMKTVQLITQYEECVKVQNYQINVDCTVLDTYTTPEDVTLSTTISNAVAGSTTSLISDVNNGTLTLNPDGSFDYVPDANYSGPDEFVYEVCAGTPVIDTLIYISAKTYSGQIATSNDDAEEESSGAMYFNSSDLEFMTDNNRGAQNAVGLRIANINVPQGAVITNAYLQFIADETDTTPTSLTINAEATGNAPTFANVINHISTKTRTTSTVAWNNVPEWVIDATYDSPDITSIIQELTDRNDWASGNAMSFIIEGTGQRVAESYDNINTTKAPKLFINYESVDSVSIIETGNLVCTAAIVEIDVTPVNDTPIAIDDDLTTTEDIAANGDVLPNDSDIENDALSVNTTPVTNPANGTVTLNADGTYTYTPNADFTGTDTFEYEVCDNGSPSACATASVVITINAVNDAPLAVADNYTATEDNVLSDNVMTNDSDIENDNMTVTTSPVTPPANGSVVLSPNGDFDYTPNPDFNGTDSFQYEVCDNGTPAECTITTVSIDITPVNDAPIAVDDNVSTPEEAAITINIVSNDINVDGDNLTANTTLITQPTNGTVFILGNGSSSYTPNTNFSGTDTFEYEVCDNGNPALCDTAMVTITVDNINDAPLAVADTYSMIANDTLQMNVLTNDIDPESDSLIVGTSPILGSGYGSLIMQPNGDFDYIPEPGYTGTVTFSYQVCDDGTPVECTTAQVTIAVELDCVDVRLFAWMEGPYDETTFEMTNELNVTRRLLPGQTPVSGLAVPTPAGQPYSVAPWNYAGTEGAAWTDANYATDMVDWVLVSFRTDIASNTEIAQTAGIINKDGSITFPDRCGFTAIQGIDSVYAVVEHRNHIGIMTPNRVEIINGVLTHDFRTSESYRDPTGFGQKQLSTGEWAMYAGDVDQSDFPSFDIKGTDKAEWILDNGVFDQYLNTDFDLNGDVNGADKLLWFENNGISSRVPK